MTALVDFDRLMLDVSLALTESGVAWLEEKDRLGPALVVSAAFSEALPTVSESLLAQFADPPQREYISTAREVLPARLDGVERFSHRQVRTLPRAYERVRRRLLDDRGLEGEILADEFVYLVTQSWLLAKTRKLLAELERAGVRVREYADERGQRFVLEMVKAVIPEKKIPTTLTAEVIAKAGVKWIVVGGATAGFTLANPIAGAVGGLLLPPGVKAFDP